MKNRILSKVLSLACLVGLGFGAPAQADEVADFYKGKTMTLLLSTGVGGGNDLNARTLMHYMTKYIPGKPDFVAKNMPGAGQRAGKQFPVQQGAQGRHLYRGLRPVLRAAPGSGRQGRQIRCHQVKLSGIDGGQQLDPRCLQVEAQHQQFRRSEETRTHRRRDRCGVGDGHLPHPLQFDIRHQDQDRPGYKSGNNIDLAMERGEVFGRAGNTFDSINAVHPTWLKSGTFKIMVQVGLRKEPGYEQIPLAIDLAKNAEDRQVIKLYSGVVAVGNPIFTNQGVPRARVAALRKAFDSTMKDPVYLKDMKKKRLYVAPTSGADLAQIVHDIVNAPPAVIAKARSAMSKQQLVPCKKFTSAKYCRSKKKKKKRKAEQSCSDPKTAGITPAVFCSRSDRQLHLIAGDHVEIDRAAHGLIADAVGVQLVAFAPMDDPGRITGFSSPVASSMVTASKSITPSNRSLVRIKSL